MTVQECRLGRLDRAARALLFTDARTARCFTSTPVTDNELRAIWDLTKWAPTSANTQPLRVVYIRTPEGRARLIDCLAVGNKAKAASAPVCAILAVDTQFHELIPELVPFRPDLRDTFRDDEQLRLRTGEFNSALQAGYFILAVRSMGLAAGPMEGFDGPELDRQFFPDSRYKSILTVNIGHPADNAWLERLPRLALDETVSWA